MGIKGLLELFPIAKPHVVRNAKIAIDANYLIARTASTTVLSSESGETQHLSSIFANILSASREGNSIIFVFDTKSRPEKAAEQAKRRESAAKINFGEKIKSTKQLLTAFQIPFLDSAPHCEAEHLCAELARKGYVNYVWTGDLDVILFGSPNLINKYRAKEKPKEAKTLKTDFKIVEAAQMLKAIDGTVEDLRVIGVTLGCDFADKTPRIGPKTILKHTIEELREMFSDDQEVAIEIFSEPPKPPREFKWATLKPWLEANLKPVQITDKIKKDVLTLLASYDFNIERLNKQFAK